MSRTEPDPKSVALLVIDMQNDFVLAGAPAEIPGTTAVVPAIRRVLDAFRSTGRPVIHVVRLYQPDGGNADLCRRDLLAGGARIVTPGSDGAEIVADLKPNPGVRLDADLLLAGGAQEIGPVERVIYKPRWGAFYQTSLGELLRRSAADSVVVCGANFPNCPRTTIYEASERDLRVALVTDACSGCYPRGEEELCRIGVALFSAGECADWLTGALLRRGRRCSSCRV